MVSGTTLYGTTCYGGITNDVYGCGTVLKVNTDGTSFAVLHAFTRGMAFRGLLLTVIYIGILLLGWVAIAIAILGLSEPMLRLRDRAAPRGQPPTQD